MSDEPITEEQEIAALKAFHDAIERFADIRSRVYLQENDEDPNRHALLVGVVVGWEVAWPADQTYQFSYTTAPEVLSPSAALGLAHRLVTCIEGDLGDRTVSVEWTGRDDEGDD